MNMTELSLPKFIKLLQDCGAKTVSSSSSAQFRCENDHFTKTGSGRTQEKLSKEWSPRFSQA